MLTQLALRYKTTLAIVEFDLDADDYTCVTCSITFATRLQFLTHRLEDHQAQKGVYVCPECKYSSARKPDVRRHLQVHLSSPGHAFKCSVCGGDFKNYRSLSSHIKCVHGYNNVPNFVPQPPSSWTRQQD
ncbi:zinc finger protein draculin-like [Varroa jacobsoni]|uniref:zinc finger protein draculin-like n=1 Tax=Varroa jacobsoni TaxID=62625 RepID=UPI000BF9DD1E|nr:zinc finger protein draculin-like [Varroa jacobsoni]